MIARLRLVLILLLLIPFTLLAIPAQFVILRFLPHRAGLLPLLWHRLAIKLIGVRVRVIGEIPKTRPMMIVANHVSWFDIPVLGSVMEVCFIAKREVDAMPVANLLARLQRSVFVAREDRRGSKDQASEITNRILGRDVMVLFAEGTTGDGHRVKEFKSSLFGAAQFAVAQGEEHAVSIQPVSIAYTRLFGMPLGRYHQAQAAWPGGLELLPHARNFLLKGAYDVEVSFGAPIIFDENSKRREIARLSRETVRTLFNRSMRQPG